MSPTRESRTATAPSLVGHDLEVLPEERLVVRGPRSGSGKRLLEPDARLVIELFVTRFTDVFEPFVFAVEAVTVLVVLASVGPLDRRATGDARHFVVGAGVPPVASVHTGT